MKERKYKIMNNFTFVGKIQAIKDTESFHPVEKKTFDSGWSMTTVKFNCISGTNRIMCLVQGGKWNDEKKNVVKTIAKTVTKEDGSVTRGEKIEIPWNKRFDEKEIEKVAGYRKFVVDLGDAQMRYALQNAVKAFEEGNITDELIAKTGCNTLEDAKAALEKSMARRHVFLAESDFADFMVKVVASDKIKDTLFRISGYQEAQYNAEKDRFYVNYRVNRVDIAKEGLNPATDMNIDFYFGKDCVNDDDFDETGVGYINGYTTYFDNMVKKNGFMPMILVVRDKAKLNVMKRRLVADDDEIKNVGFVGEVIQGANMSAITMEDLSDEDREDIECGLVTFEDLVAARGGQKVGDYITEIRLSGWNARKKTIEDTTYTVDDMHPARADVNEDDDDIL